MRLSMCPEPSSEDYELHQSEIRIFLLCRKNTDKNGLKNQMRNYNRILQYRSIRSDRGIIHKDRRNILRLFSVFVPV